MPTATPHRVQRAVLRAFGGLFAAAAGVLAVLFLIASAYDGFRFTTPVVRISCRQPAEVFWYALGSLGAWCLVRRARGRFDRDACAATPAVFPVSRYLLVFLTGFLAACIACFWIRSLYFSYEGFLLGVDSWVKTPFWESHVIYGFVFFASLFTWWRLRPRLGVLAALTAAVVVAAAPVQFYVSARMAASFAEVAVLLLFGDLFSAHFRGKRRNRGVWALSAVVLVALVTLLHVAGHGWAGPRVADRIAERVAPGSCWVLVLFGLAGWRSADVDTRGMLSALILPAFVGLGLAGAREELGDLGAVLLVAPCAVLTATGVAFCWTRRWVKESVFAQNVVLILLLGILFGVFRHGIETHVRAPRYARSLFERVRPPHRLLPWNRE